MRNVQDLRIWTGVAGRALSEGAQKVSPLTLRWNVAGREGSPTACLKPINRVYRGAKALSFGSTEHQASSDNPTYAIDMDVRCRKCAGCLKARAALWRIRMVHEIAMAERTWFGTLTLNPHNRFTVVSRARLRLDRGGTDLDRLEADERFAELVKETNPALTKFFKRVRKASGSKLRYILVSEPHKDGFPHWHCLIHEREGAVTVRELQSQWLGGFSNFKLVDQSESDKQAFYVAKYLAKEARTRVRASLGYGCD